jgi:hypothetical protein
MKISRTFFNFFEELKNIENRVAWFLAELCKAEKGVQKDKRNQRRTAPRYRKSGRSITDCHCVFRGPKTIREKVGGSTLNQPV